ncbi:MAG: hypothetical protein EHM24_31640 [Acidobacteria bacterium]|nr:MAG: hypothetical protein EHM24_31640 [Acidobacteriota bacterium]RPJ80402.1 MAG: hypothetical protein EHM13_12095 [Acidobacteriota bacterium]
MVLLIGAEWRPRTLVRAELLERGYETFAVESWDEAHMLLAAGAIRPDVTVFDLPGEDNPEAALRSLAGLVRPEAVVVLTGEAALPAGAVSALGYPHVVARPFDVGQIVRRVEAVREAQR